MNTPKRHYARPLDLKHGRIDMNHGAGGRLSMQLIEEVFIRAFDNEFLRQGNDGALLPATAGQRLVMATDAHVISPLFFPGGDIGCLAVNGTVNDVAMLAATPLYLSASFILEEGLLLSDLKRIVDSMASAASHAGVPVITGDTKVVEKGCGDGVFICTTGVGVLLSGTIGDHGIAVLSLRESLEFDTTIESDTAALHTLVAAMLAAVPTGAIHVLRDPTRGGLATTLNEIARQSDVGMMLQESAIPILPQVDAACELLGLDPLYIANEGKLVAIVAGDSAAALLEAMKAHPLGKAATCIGYVTEDSNRFVQMNTSVGGQRVVDWLSGEPMPRIC
jgi:hydrogenase expression/formation protein HypE